MEYASHLHDAGHLDTYERQTLRSAGGPVVQAYHALWATVGARGGERDQVLRARHLGDHIGSDPAARDFLDAVAAPLRPATSAR